MRIGFIDQKHTLLVRVEIGEDEEHLLESAAGRRNVQHSFYAGLLIVQQDRPPRGFLRGLQCGLKEPMHQLNNTHPVVGRAFGHHETEVAQDFGGAALT